jgi:hypothetical protein
MTKNTFKIFCKPKTIKNTKKIHKFISFYFRIKPNQVAFCLAIYTDVVIKLILLSAKFIILFVPEKLFLSSKMSLKEKALTKVHVHFNYYKFFSTWAF